MSAWLAGLRLRSMPQASAGLSDGGHDCRLGLRLSPVAASGSFDLASEATWRETAYAPDGSAAGSLDVAEDLFRGDGRGQGGFRQKSSLPFFRLIEDAPASAFEGRRPRPPGFPTCLEPAAPTSSRRPSCRRSRPPESAGEHEQVVAGDADGGDDRGGARHLQRDARGEQPVDLRPALSMFA